MMVRQMLRITVTCRIGDPSNCLMKVISSCELTMFDSYNLDIYHSHEVSN